MDPREVALYSNRAACYLQMKEPLKAIKDCQKALEINPTFIKAHKRMFNAYLALGNLEVRREKKSYRQHLCALES